MNAVMVGNLWKTYGALTNSNTTSSSTTYGNNISSAVWFDITASNYNAIYAKSNTVQPKALCTQYLIKY